MNQTTLFNFNTSLCCSSCKGPGPLFEEWYSDTLPEGNYCEACIEGEYDEV